MSTEQSVAPVERWWRVVDAQHQGWHPTVGAGETVVYAADYGSRRDLASRSLAELERDRGPLRPVLLITGEDEQELRVALAAAGRKAVYTVAVAVYVALRELREQHGGLSSPQSWHLARRQLLAGREGSWESEALIDLAMWSGLGTPSRVHEPARRTITAMIVRWVSDPARYTEVAETLAEVVSGSVVELGGWAAVADQWLQPGALDETGVQVTRGLFAPGGARDDGPGLG